MSRTNLPNNHGILISSFLALLSEELSCLTRAIQKQTPTRCQLLCRTSIRKMWGVTYRTQNLPNCTSFSEVYELGIAVSRRKAGREASRLDPDYIVPVYVGKSDNVRTRLQRYGRDGAHLENDCSKSELHVHENVSGPKRAGLFTETFSRGFSIVYRWAPMNDNKDAERTETLLLDKFDYAWNKGSNGVRR